MSIGPLPDHTWRRNRASTIFEASTSLATTRRSAGDSADRSTVMSVGTKRAAIACSRAASGTAACSARGMATATAPANSAKTIVGFIV
jgi:hypothetical protein